MARIKHRIATDRYTEHTVSRREAGENKDCSVRAVAVVCGLSYEAALAALAAVGREPGRGAPASRIREAIESLGFQLERVDLQERIAQYPGAHANLKNVTTHHPARFPKVWADGEAYLFYTDRHVAGVTNGVNHDWTLGRACHVESIYRVFRKS